MAPDPVQGGSAPGTTWNPPPVVVGGIDAAGKVRTLLVGTDGRTLGVAPTNATNTVYATNLVVSAAAATLYGLTGYNSKTATQFIQIHNAASLPAENAVPAVFIAVPASSNFAIDFGALGKAFATGIVVCNSSTGPTKTIGSADIWLEARYV